MKKELFPLLVLVLVLGIGLVSADDPASPLDAGTLSGTEVTLATATVSANGLIGQVDPGTLPCENLADFEDVTGGSAPGTNYNAILVSGGLEFAERFSGQTLSYSGDFDVLSGTPSDPLALQIGTPNHNLDVYHSAFGDSNVLAGLGPLGYPDHNAIAEGSVAVLFPNPQIQFKFDILGVDGGGSATVDFFRADGSSLGTIVLNPNIDQTYGFAHTGGLREIAGFSIYNSDPAGIVYDDICYVKTIAVNVDIKPGSCPNPLNPGSRGVLPVAVLGTDDFDVSTIDPTTLQLAREGFEEGVAPLRWSYEDVATPFTGDQCSCHDFNGDGYTDLSLKFESQEVMTALELGDEAGKTIPLTITGELLDDTPIEGRDCMRVLKTGK